MAKRRLRLDIRGIVQGVGFRPFLHRLTDRFALSGWVRNTSAGVELELEGEEGCLEQFLAALTAEAPPLAVIAAVAVAALIVGYRYRALILKIVRKKFKKKKKTEE